MKRIRKILCLFLTISLACSLFTGCEQSADEELIARNNALASTGWWKTSDGTGLYLNFLYLNYIDTQNATGVPVCAKPECTHERDGSCFSTERGHDSRTIYYYKDHLYYDRDSILYNSDGAGTNEKECIDFRKLMDDQAKTFINGRENMRTGLCSFRIVGVREGKLYLFAQMEILQSTASDDVVSDHGVRSIRAIYTYDPISDKTECLTDGVICELIEKYADLLDEGAIYFALCGDLLLTRCITTDFDIGEKEQWKAHVYNLKSKKILKEWSVSDTENSENMFLINADKTFLCMERTGEKVLCTEYNEACEKIAEFTLGSGCRVIKEDGYYYVSYPDENAIISGVNEIIRLNPKDSVQKKITVGGGFFPCNAADFYGIVNGKMIGQYASADKYLYALLDLSCFDTGKAEVQPVEGIAPLRRD